MDIDAGGRKRIARVGIQVKSPSWKSLMPQPALPRLSADCPSRCLHCAARALSLCAALNSAELHDLEKLGHEARFSSKEALFSEEENVGRVYSLTQGVARLYKLLLDGRCHIVGRETVAS